MNYKYDNPKTYHHDAHLDWKVECLQDAGFEVRHFDILDHRGLGSSVPVVFGIRTRNGEYHIYPRYEKVLGPYPVYPDNFDKTDAPCSYGMHMKSDVVKPRPDTYMYLEAAMLVKDTAGGGVYSYHHIQHVHVNKIRGKKIFLSKRKSTLVNNVKRYLTAAMFFNSTEY
jgi:hypothetical protein